MKLAMKLLAFFCILLAIITIFLLFQHSPELEYSVITFYTNDTNISFTCEIADDASSRTKGLIGRDQLDNDHGMLFVYDAAEQRTFHMRDMNFPLDILFIDEHLTVINIVSANISEENIQSIRPARYVLEINQDLCRHYGIDEGTRVSISEKLNQ